MLALTSNSRSCCGKDISGHYDTTVVVVSSMEIGETPGVEMYWAF